MVSGRMPEFEVSKHPQGMVGVIATKTSGGIPILAIVDGYAKFAAGAQRDRSLLSCAMAKVLPVAMASYCQQQRVSPLDVMMLHLDSDGRWFIMTTTLNPQPERTLLRVHWSELKSLDGESPDGSDAAMRLLFCYLADDILAVVDSMFE